MKSVKWNDTSIKVKLYQLLTLLTLLNVKLDQLYSVINEETHQKSNTKKAIQRVAFVQEWHWGGDGFGVKHCTV